MQYWYCSTLKRNPGPVLEKDIIHCWLSTSPLTDTSMKLLKAINYCKLFTETNTINLTMDDDSIHSHCLLHVDYDICTSTYLATGDSSAVPSSTHPNRLLHTGDYICNNWPPTDHV